MILEVENVKLKDIFGPQIEVLNTGLATGEENMRFDIERTKLCSESNALPMFRFYGWKPWCVSLGANQKNTDIDEKKCMERGFDIVRRPTGGRAVLHANELTYSVVLRLPENMTVHDVYREIHIILLNGLRMAGCGELDFEKAQPDFREIYSREGFSASCFASSARYEIEWQGKKLVGSAQRLFGNTLLQHGSILIGKGYEQLDEVVNVSSEDIRKRLREFTKSHSISLEEISGRKYTCDECAESIKEILKG